MNEFIVWDYDNEKFIDEAKVIFCDGTIYRNSIDFGHGISDDLQHFNYIGKTDINDKKIYADCSIVEFDFRTIDSQKVRGVFEYSNFHLCYFIHLVNDKRSRAFKFDVTLMNKFKIIDTIQENKLGLIK